MVHNDCLDGVGLDEKEKGRCDSNVFTFTDSGLKNDLIEFRPGVRMIQNSYIQKGMRSMPADAPSSPAICLLQYIAHSARRSVACVYYTIHTGVAFNFTRPQS